MKNLLILCFLALLPFPAFAAEKESAYDRVMKTHTLRCGYILYPPYMEKDLKTGKFSGPAYDIAEELGKTLGLKMEWVEEVAVGGEVASLESHRFDSVCSVTGTYDPGMFLQIEFSKPLFYIDNTIFSRSGDSRFAGKKGFKDLNNPDLTFVGIEGDSTSIYAKLLFPKAKIKELPQLTDPSQLFLELSAKKADLIIVESAIAARATKNNVGQFQQINFIESLPKYSVTLAVAKDSYELRDAINQGIDYMHLNGTIDKILDKHDPKRETLIRIPAAYTK